MADWDAARYHRVSDPQRGWGLRVLDRLAPARGERILDIGCGTGRLTSEVARRAPDLTVVALDRSATMLSEATRHSGERARFLQADAAALPFRSSAFDAVFSTATFHWVRDHDRLFAEIHRVLASGGRLVSQAGGGPNLATLRRRSEAVQRQPEFVSYFKDWNEPWRYADVEETRARLAACDFVDIEVSLEPAPTPLDDEDRYKEFVACVCLRRQLDLLPPGRHDAYLRPILDLAAQDDPPFTLDYWRLNIDARKR